MSLIDDARVLQDDLVALRRAIHADPEVGLDLPRTQQRVLDALQDLPLEITLGEGLSSVVALLRGKPGPLVLLRGDMDALHLVERTGELFASTSDAMHACGHDLHTAGLVGAARLLCARKDELVGDVLFMFQPGEEADDGAGQMIAEGLLDVAGRRPDAAYGLHVMSGGGIAAGTFSGRRGPFMAAADVVHVRVLGAGGHGSMPQYGLDPVPVACEIVLAIQAMVTRRFDIFDPVVVTVGRIAGGTMVNIIPDEAHLDITVRTFTLESRARIKETLPRVCTHVAAAHGLTVDIDYHDGYPPTINDAAEAEFVADTVADLFGAQRYEWRDHPLPGAEDFSRVLQAIPGAYVFLGTCVTGDADTAPSNHASDARFDDRWLCDGAALLAELALRRMARG